jgi:hypothetical protein
MAAPETAKTTHPFDRAGLGAPPYRFLGVRKNWFVVCPGEPGKPGGSCDYCGQGIAFEFHVEAANGKRFKVGSDCIAKVNRTAVIDTELDKARRKHERTVRHEREEAFLVEGRAFLARPEVIAALTARPHPQEWRAVKGETLADMVGWYMTHAGTAGRKYAIKTARAAMENRGPS